MSFDIPFELPGGWEIKTVEELVKEKIIEKPLDGNHGGTHPKSADYVSEGIPFVMASDLEAGQVNFSRCKFITEKQARKLRKGFAKAGDILISHKATIGRTAVVQENDFPFIMLTPQVTYYRVIEKEKLSNIYLKAYLDSPFFQSLMASWAGSGSTRAYLGITGQLKLPIIVPPADEQDFIAGQALSINKKIEQNNQTNQTLEAIAQALFKSWFVDFDPVKAKIETLAAGGSADDAELAAMNVISTKPLDELSYLKVRNPQAFNKLAQTAALFPSAMQDSELGDIPEGWEVKQLSEICQVINGRAYKNTEFKTEGTPIVRIQNLSNGGKTVYSDLVLPHEKYIDREDFIYAWSATFGPHIWRGPKSIYHYHIWKMEVDESVISRYFLYLSMFRKTEAMKNAGTGSIFTHLTKKIMESQNVLVGDQATNKEFSDMIVPIFDQISSLKNESTHLADIRDALLPKLLKGEYLTSEVANV
ncbi:restriction endonuclease subunit S [Pseudoalteromonas atlantica]|uniref:restriction endonuclease subunit S n=1 Tax=Pseudoalteromonas atlantica TaxID=288 RepID=UPI000BBCA452|nr:restriction endonuclease subunit S [Pseudoalteromonas atlantica]